MSSARKYIEFGVLCLLAALLLWWFGRNLDWAQVRLAVSNADPYLLVAAVVVVCTVYLTRSLRWKALLRPLTAARLADLFAATTIGFSGIFLAGRAGEFVRPVVLSMRDPRVRPSASLVTILVERIYDMTAVALMFAVNLLWFRPQFVLEVSFDRVRLAGVIMLSIVILGIVFLTWFRKRSSLVIDFCERLFARWRFVPHKISQFILGILEQQLDRFNLAQHRIRQLSRYESVSPASRTHGNDLRPRMVAGRFTRADSRRRCRRFSRCDCRGTAVSRRQERDGGGTLDRFAPCRFWSSTPVRNFLSHTR
jgi:uncharacterized protein (TIRG00374 family)